MNLNKLIFSLISVLFLFSIFCSITIGMSWDEPWHHINGALRAEYLKSFGNFKNYDFSDNKFYPGLYDTFSFLFSNFLAKVFSTEFNNFFRSIGSITLKSKKGICMSFN